MKITIYTISDCKFSQQEKNYLQSRGLPFEEKNLETNKDYLTEMLALSNNFAGTPVTKIEKDDGQITVLKGFTQDEFEAILGPQMSISQPTQSEQSQTPQPQEFVQSDTNTNNQSSQPAPYQDQTIMDNSSQINNQVQPVDQTTQAQQPVDMNMPPQNNPYSQTTAPTNTNMQSNFDQQSQMSYIPEQPQQTAPAQNINPDVSQNQQSQPFQDNSGFNAQTPYQAPQQGQSNFPSQQSNINTPQQFNPLSQPQQTVASQDNMQNNLPKQQPPSTNDPLNSILNNLQQKANDPTQPQNQNTV